MLTGTPNRVVLTAPPTRDGVYRLFVGYYWLRQENTPLFMTEHLLCDRNRAVLEQLNPDPRSHIIEYIERVWVQEETL